MIRISLFVVALLPSLGSFADDVKPSPPKSQRIIGAMTCEAIYEYVGTPNGYDMFGCRMPRPCNFMPLKQFFEKNRKSKNYEMLEVIYNNFNNQFIIYYGNKME